VTAVTLIKALPVLISIHLNTKSPLLPIYGGHSVLTQLYLGNSFVKRIALDCVNRKSLAVLHKIPACTLSNKFALIAKASLLEKVAWLDDNIQRFNTVFPIMFTLQPQQ
jgi:hypothetical protein